MVALWFTAVILMIFVRFWDYWSTLIWIRAAAAVNYA